jgi:hypothetical protein
MLMGVLSLMPDSFSDGGKYSEPDRAFARALEIEEQGADILDIGAESTKPGAAPISAARRNAPAHPRAQAAEGPAKYLDFRGYLQGRDRRAGARFGRRDH